MTVPHRPAQHRLLSVLLIHERDAYVAVCLEHFLAAQGTTLEQAQRALVQTLVTQIGLDVRAGRAPLAQHGPAPEKYWRAFQQAVRREVAPEPVVSADVPLLPAFLVEAITETLPAEA